MAANKENKKSRLAQDLRLSVYNDITHEEVFTYKINKLKVVSSITISILLIICSIVALFFFTPLKEFIPGYPSSESRRLMIQNALVADSLRNQINLWKLQLISIQKIANGEEPLDIASIIATPNSSDTVISKYYIYSKDDSLLRSAVLDKGRINNRKFDQLEALHFFPPVKGIISEEYNLAISHPYIDIAATKNSVVSSILDGTVISAGWSDEYGYTIQIQHDNNLVSAYKHNAKLLKKIGEKVNSGTPIALVGDTGTLSNGPHLHFELWHRGETIDPTKYIKF